MEVNPERIVNPSSYIGQSYDIATIISILLLIATVLGSFAALASLNSARQNNRTTKASATFELATGWRAIQREWKLAQVIVRGVGDYYSPISEDYEKLINEAHEKYQVSFNDANYALSELRIGIENLVQFFDRISRLILDGMLTPSEAYAILGPEFARHGRVVRWSVGAAEATPGIRGINEEEGSYSWVNYLISMNLRGRRSRIIYLSDAMWSELVRLRDLKPHNISAVAIHKKTNSTGLQAQKRAFDLARRQGGRRLGLKLSFHLTYAEFISTSTFKEYGEDEMDKEDSLKVGPYEELRDAKCLRVWWREIILLKYRILAP